jgi:acetylornithine deacetylase
MDTVPADDWIERAFIPRVVDGYVIGRGACDDKGSLAAMVVAILEILESGERPPQPVWLLAAGDEEYSQCGIRDFLETEHLPIGRAVFGEPTELQPVVQHKATIRWDITAHGRAAHTSRAELGHSAILDIVKVIDALGAYERDLKRMHLGSLTSGPSLTVTMIEGGRARNIVPDTCKIAVDFRAPPELDARRGFADLFEQLNELGLSLTHGEFQCFAPALRTDPQHEFVKSVVEFCRDELRRDVEPTGVPYGSDAGWMPRSIPTIVLGPGSIAQAHAADEHVEIKQLAQAVGIYHRIVSCDWSGKATR